MIDLSNPAHVEVLRAACRLLSRDPSYCISATLRDDGPPVSPEYADALRSITEPLQAADLLRRLLERCGVYSARANGLSDSVDVSWGYAESCDEHEPGDPGCEHGLHGDVDVALASVPARVLAMLDATDRASVLAALVSLKGVE